MIRFVNPSRGHITQRYGNTQPDGMPHAGQDYAYTNGTETFPEVYAAADGVVQFAGDSRNLGWPNPWYVNPDFNRADNWDSSAGNLIALRHNQFSADTGYGHLEKCLVKEGDQVKAGQLIGITGNTGNSYGKHLHFFLMFHPFNYNTSTYGCSDPNPYFGTGITPQGTITPLREASFLMALTDKQQEDLHYVLCTDEGRQIHAQKFADVVFRTSLGMFDGGKPTFEEVLAVSNDRLGHIKRSTDLLAPFDVDVRGDLANKGAQLADLKGSQSTISPMEVADAVIAELGSDLAQVVVDEIGKRIAK